MLHAKEALGHLLQAQVFGQSGLAGLAAGELQHV